MRVLRFWLTSFRDGLLAAWGLIYLSTISIRLLNYSGLMFDSYYATPPLEDVLRAASYMGAVFATLYTLYCVKFAESFVSLSD